MLDKLKKKIENNQIIQVSFFENNDVDELLDMRDEMEFDSEWMRVYNFLNEMSIRECEKNKINDIREKTFLMAYTLSNSSDIASCVSDDLEIICKAYILEYNDDWLNSLIMSYARGEFPCGKLKKTEWTIKECVHNLLSEFNR